MFDSSCSTGSPTAYAWRLGAGTSSVVGTNATLTRTFNEPGSYRVRLTVTGSTGSGATSMVLTVGGEGAEGPEGAEDCGGWFNIVCHMKAALTAVFIPPADTLSAQWDGLADAAEGHWPLGPVLWGTQTLGTMYGAFTSGCGHGTICEGSSQGLATDYGECSGDWGPTLQFDGEATQTGDDDVKVRVPIVPCEATDGETGLGPVRNATLWGSRVVMVVGFVMMLLRLVGVRIGRGGDDD